MVPRSHRLEHNPYPLKCDNAFDAAQRSAEVLLGLSSDVILVPDSDSDSFNPRVAAINGLNSMATIHRVELNNDSFAVHTSSLVLVTDGLRNYARPMRHNQRPRRLQTLNVYRGEDDELMVQSFIAHSEPAQSQLKEAEVSHLEIIAATGMYIAVGRLVVAHL